MVLGVGSEASVVRECHHPARKNCFAIVLSLSYPSSASSLSGGAFTHCVIKKGTIAAPLKRMIVSVLLLLYYSLYKAIAVRFIRDLHKVDAIGELAHVYFGCSADLAAVYHLAF